MKNSCFWRFLNTIRQQEWLSFEEKETLEKTLLGVKTLWRFGKWLLAKPKKKARKICFQTKALDQEKHFSPFFGLFAVSR